MGKRSRNEFSAGYRVLLLFPSQYSFFAFPVRFSRRGNGASRHNKNRAFIDLHVHIPEKDVLAQRFRDASFRIHVRFLRVQHGLFVVYDVAGCRYAAAALHPRFRQASERR